MRPPKPPQRVKILEELEGFSCQNPRVAEALPPLVLAARTLGMEVQAGARARKP